MQRSGYSEIGDREDLIDNLSIMIRLRVTLRGHVTNWVLVWTRI